MFDRRFVAFLSVFVLIVITLGTNESKPVAASWSFADAENVKLVGQIKVPSSSVAVQGKYAFVGGGYIDGGLRIIDISDISAPQQVGFVDTPGSATDVDIVGTYAYVADWTGGLRIINITDPTKPIEVGNVLSLADEVVVNGPYAYVVDDSDLRVVEVTNPEIPVEIGSYATPGSAMDLAVEGNYAYVADLYGGLRVINIQNPEHPVEAGSFIPGWTTYIDVAGKTVYVHADYAMSIIDVTNPAAPEQIGFYEPLEFPADWGGLTVSGDHVYFASGDDGLIILDVNDPTSPTRVGYYDTPGKAQDVFIDGDFVFVADGDNGLLILQFSNGTSNMIYIPLIEAME